MPPEFHSVKMAHAAISPLVFALFMPLGAIMIRVFTFRGVLWFHAGWMFFNYILSLAALGTGIYLAYYIQKLDSAHEIIGLVAICGCILQPVTGFAHHLFYKSVGRPNNATYPHVWWGRTIITLGAINGGIGLQLSRCTKETGIGYGVGAGVVWALWMAVILMAFIRSRKTLEGETGEKIFGMEPADERMKRVDSSQLSQTVSDKELAIA
jgi:hypothetical protein